MAHQHTQLLTLAEAAEELGVRIKTVRRYVAGERLPAFRLGPRLLRVRRTDVDALLRPIPTAGSAA